LSLAARIAALRTPGELYELLDPDVMWYSADVNSNHTCNDREDVIACIERNVADGLTGRFEVLVAEDDFVVVQPVLDRPRSHTFSLLLRVRDDAIVEMRDFGSPAAAFRYAGIEPASAAL
jgi:hypothetical protein